MKKILIIASVILFFGIIPTVFAAENFVPLAPIPGLTQGVVADSTGLATFFNNLYKYLIGLAAILAVIQIIWAGLGIAYTHKDAVSEIMNDKGKIKNALLGLVLVLSPVLVFSIINPNILNLSLNLPAINLSKTEFNDGGGGGEQIVSNVEGCVVTTGPAIGTKLATCTVANDAGTKTDTEMKEGAVEEAAQFVKINCPSDGGTMMGATYSGSCTSHTNTNTNGYNIKICSQATAIAYCSLVLTVNIAREIKNAKYLKSFGENNVFASSCEGGRGWSLVEVESKPISTGYGGGVITSAGGTPITCPDEVKTALKNYTYECVSEPIYCMYIP